MVQKLSNKDVAVILNEIGTFLELKGDNPFKVRAYYNSARTIQRLPTDLSELIESGELRKIKGIGDALAKKIVTIISTGSLPYYEDLKASIPSGLREMLRIPGLGAKKVHKLWKYLEIATLGELEYACNENRLVTLEGFGLKTQEKVLEGINFLKKYANRFLLSYALNEANKIVSILESHSKVRKLSVAGSVRRKREIIKNIDIVADVDIKDRTEVLQFLSKSTYTDSTLFSTNVPLIVNQNHASIKSEIGINVDIYFAGS
ncbi:MAG: histidinol-phosphatase, partial [Candidatus Neomarinimicrobiota bacterium]